MNVKPLNLLASTVLSLTLMSAGCGNSNHDGAESLTTDSVGDAQATLPHFGEFDIEFHKSDDGTVITDTVYMGIPKFSFTNQFGQETSYKDYQNTVFIADFFFTECPSICPILSSQMARLQTMTKKEGLEKSVKFISYSVKPDHDTPEILKEYGEKIGADFSNWNFVTGKAEDIYELAEEGYMLSAFPSETADGGIFHTEKITLIDSDMHIRGYYDGTSTKSVDQLFLDLKNLLKEESHDAKRQS
jgi:protein SCO1